MEVAKQSVKGKGFPLAMTARIDVNVIASLNFVTYNIPEWAPSRSWDVAVLSLTFVRRDEI